MTDSSSESGFSLLELLVAMVITLIVSGAIFGLMTAGQNAFRREPELAERQQNIRLAMDMMVRDLANAGTGLPPFTQVFTQGLGNAAASPVGPSGARSDDIEMLTVSGRDSEPVCLGANNGTLPQATLVRNSITGIDPGTMAFLVFTNPALPVGLDEPPPVHDDMWTVRRVTAVGPAISAPVGGQTWDDCQAGNNHAVLHFATTNGQNAATVCENSPLPPVGNLVAPCGYRLTRVVFGRQVRYQVRPDGDGVPVLQRVSSEDPANPQTLARGIEELQVDYKQFSTPAATWDGSAPDVLDPAVTGETWLEARNAGKFASMVSRVRVTLTSRAEGRRLQGATAAASAPDPRLRGSLTTTVSPRAALLGAAHGRPSPDPGAGVWE
jgi:prepilin-type N-terminal cleavage/methylation domain-containing protein